MNCEQLIEVILAIGRVSVLIIGMFGGIFSIYLGWSLYRDRIVSKTGGEASFKELRIGLTASGPGVFLALFGAYLLVTIVNLRVDLSNNEVSPATPRPTSSSYQSGVSTAEMRMVVDKQATPALTSSSAVSTIPCLPCLIRKQNRVLYDGAIEMTSSELSESLEDATRVVSAAIPLATDNAHKAQLRRAVAALSELRAGVVK